MSFRTDQEIRLLDYAERLSRHTENRLAVHIHLSRLRSHREDHHVRIACNCFEVLVRRYDGQLFVLSNRDIVFVAKGAKRSEVDKVVTKLRYLFNEDPLADEAGRDTGRFCTWYDLERDHEDFYAAAAKLKRQAEARRNRARAAGARSAEEMQPEHLGRLVEQLSTMDLSALIRRQPVCAVAPDGELRPVFNEVFVSIGDLQRRVMPGVELASNPHLFAYLTQHLDRRLLRTLPELEAQAPLSTSININVQSVLSPQFLEFDNRLRAQTRKTIVLEVQPANVFADVGSYLFARDFVRDRGYRMCLDALSHLTFPLIDTARLRLDMQKIVWSDDMLELDGSTRLKQLADAIRRAGTSRVILCRCDSPAALEFGRSLGLSLFQGRHVDRSLAATAARRRVA